MKTVLAIFAFMSIAVTAKADSCDTVLWSMTSITYSYTSLVYTCQGEQPGTPAYAQAQQSARQIESEYQTTQNECYTACASNPTAVSECEQPISGACP